MISGIGERGSTRFSGGGSTGLERLPDLERLPERGFGRMGSSTCSAPPGAPIKNRVMQYERTAQTMQKSQKGKTLCTFDRIPNSFQFPSSSNISRGRKRRTTTTPIKYKIAARRSVLICRKRRLLFLGEFHPCSSEEQG